MPALGGCRMAFHLRGIVVPDGEERDLYVVGDRITFEPLTRAETVVDGGWLLPGLVDVHTRPGAEPLVIRWMRRCCAGTAASTATRG